MEIVSQIHDEIKIALSEEQEIDDSRVKEIIEMKVLDSELCRSFTQSQQRELIESIFNRMRRYDVLQPLLDDESVTEVMINGPKQIFIERAGRIEKSDVQFESAERLEAVVQQIVADVDRQVNRSSPIADARLRDGSRVNVVLPPIALDGAAVTIRKFGKEKLTIEKLINYGALNEELSGFLEKAVRTRHNILVCGGTGSGKTTFLNALSDVIPKDERVVTIEDSAELKLDAIPNLIRMETRHSGKDSTTNITMSDLIRASLRMRPDRIVVGEVRGAEALDMLQAMNTGHEGSLTTGHSNSGPDMLHRLESMILSGAAELPLHSIRAQIASGLDLIVYLRRFKNGSRKVVSVDEVVGIENDAVKLNQIYQYTQQDGHHRTGEMVHKWKFETYDTES